MGSNGHIFPLNHLHPSSLQIVLLSPVEINDWDIYCLGLFIFLVFDRTQWYHLIYVGNNI